MGTYGQVLCKLNTHVLMGRRTQITAPPALFVPNPGVGGDPVAVFLLYDPDQGCAGEAYIVQFNFNTNGSSGARTAPSLKKTLAYDAGVGAASGFAVAGSSGHHRQERRGPRRAGGRQQGTRAEPHGGDEQPRSPSGGAS